MKGSYTYFIFPYFILPFFQELPIWIVLTSLFLWVLSFYFFSISYMFNRWIPHFAAIIASLLIYQHYKTLLGPEAGTALIMILVALKLFDLRKKSDYMTVYFSKIILLMNWLLFSQTLLSTVYMILGLILIFIGFLNLNFIKRPIREVLTAGPRLVSLDTLYAVPIFLTLFLIFPRFNISLGKYVINKKTTVGFSGYLTPGEMANLAQSNEPAFRVIFLGERPAPQKLYWRGLVLTQTDGFNWSQSVFKQPLTKENISSGGVINYNVILEPKFQKTLFTLENPLSLEWTDSTKNSIFSLKANSFETLYPLLSRSYYQGQSFLNTSKHFDQEDLESYLELPKKQSTALEELVRQWKSKAKTTEDLTQLILQYYRDNGFAYSMSTPTMRSHEEFFLQNKVGFCEHYASSFSVLMRMAGVPSRVIIGFQGGEYNEYGDYLLVKDRHAHAWSEIWIKEKGWTRVDPTSAINEIRINTGNLLTSNEIQTNGTLSKLWGKTNLMIDSVNNAYMFFMLRYNYDKQIQYFDSLGLKNMNRQKIFLILFLVICLLGALVFLIQIRTDRKKDPLTESYQLLLKKLEKKGFIKKSTEGSWTFSQKVSDPKGAELLANYTRLRYGPKPHKKSIQKFSKQTKSL